MLTKSSNIFSTCSINTSIRSTPTDINQMNTMINTPEAKRKLHPIRKDGKNSLILTNAEKIHHMTYIF